MKRNRTLANQGGFHGNPLWRYRGFAALILALLRAGPAGVVRAQIVTEFRIPCVPPCEPHGAPHGIAASPDGTVWFTKIGVDTFQIQMPAYIGRITTPGVISSFPFPVTSGPASIVEG